MPKLRKIGFDKLPGPVIDTFLPLQDYLTGNILLDEVGNPIVTEERGTVAQLARADQSTSVVINTESADGINPIRVREVFPEVSEVSNSLLGVPRAETQLSLFSDVSTYGLDVDNWEYYNFSSPLFYPEEWYNRTNPIYGERGRVTFNEATNEQALYLRAYPVQYTYPYGPNDRRRYNSTLFKRYLNFIAVGKILYNYFNSIGFTDFANNNFINEQVVIVNSSGDEISDLDFDSSSLGTIQGNSNFYDVKYGSNIKQAFDSIERFTSAYSQITGGIFSYPVSNSNVISLDRAVRASANSASPGYSFRGNYYGVLQSRQTFRYQPGRISGFTFGVRSKTDTTTNENFIEWGCANDTDQYMFQIRGSEFNIVRRSTIPLPDDLLVRMGLTTSSQSPQPIIPPGIDSETGLYELIIKRDQFNGDKLDGSGTSGYQIRFENVTMFKIEFGWYGAIGAKFYAYVPVGNSEARWVLIHTLVIENGMKLPCLQNPDFKFKYMLSIVNTNNVQEPLYIYKYGASYYIDGGDEGTLYMKSVASEVTTFSENTPVLTLHTKKIISNSVGEETKNRKKIYPVSISTNSSELTKISIKEIVSSPDGYHYFYSPSLQNGLSGKSRILNLQLNSARDEITILDEDEEFTEKDNNAKIIANGIYNAYISYNGDPKTAKIKRRNDYAFLDLQQLGEKSLLINGTEIELDNYVINSARLTNYETVVASTIPITERLFKVHFLNPLTRDQQTNRRHFADFVLSVTDKKPSIVDGVLKFDEDQIEGGLDYNFNNELSVEWTQYEEQVDIDGRDIAEWDPSYGYIMEIDARLPTPSGTDSGRISVVIGKIDFKEYTYESIRQNVGPGINMHEIIFSNVQDAPSITDADLANNIDIGLNDQSTGIIIRDKGTPEFETSPTGTVITKFKIKVEGDVSLLANTNKFQIKSINLEDGWTVNSLNLNGVPRFSSKKFNISKNIKFANNELYLVFGLNDYARINNIVVEEINPVNTYAHTPNWIQSDTDDVVVFSGGSSINLTPASFQNLDGLTGVRYDSQLLQPLRPGEEINAFYAEPNDTTPILLSNIYERDRKTITTGLYNNRVTVFTANRVGSDPSGNIEIGVSIKEQ